MSSRNSCERNAAVRRGTAAQIRNEVIRCARTPNPGFDLLVRRRSDEPLTDGLLAHSFAGATHRFAFFTRRLGRRLFMEAASLRFAKDAFALRPFLQDAESLVDIVVAGKYLQNKSFCVCDPAGSAGANGAHAAIATGRRARGLRLHQDDANGIRASHARHCGRHARRRSRSSETCSPSSGGSATLSQPAAAEPKPMVTQGYAVGRRNASPFSRIRILSFGAHHAGHATNADCNVRRVTYTLIANGVA